MPYVEKFNITTEEGEKYEAQVKDPEAVESQEGELADTVITYDGIAGDTIESFTDFISSYVSGTKVGKWFKNFRAGIEYILHVGSLVNNCVTDNSELPLSAAQGKVLMDELTQVKSDLTELDSYIKSYCWTLLSQIAINSDEDLNDIKTIGNYYCNMNSTASTLTNSPTTSAFTMKVFPCTGYSPTDSMKAQLVITYNCRVYMRYTSNGGTSWNSWNTLA